MAGHFMDLLQENIAKIKRHDTLYSRQLISYAGFFPPPGSCSKAL